MASKRKTKRKWVAGEYWTVFPYGTPFTLCSRHRSLQAAEKAARKCEKAGGNHHRIMHVSECGR